MTADNGLGWVGLDGYGVSTSSLSSWEMEYEEELEANTKKFRMCGRLNFRPKNEG